MLRFGILGSLEVHTAAGAVPVTARKVMNVLALLLVRSPHFVGSSALIEELWPGRPPKSALSTIQTYIYHLRRLLTDIGGDAAGRCLVTVTGGYQLEISPDQLDARRFEELVLRGRVLLEAGRPVEASDLLSHALGMWRGPALADVAPGPVLEPDVFRLEELRGCALKLRIEADLRGNRHLEVIPELQSLIRRDPLHEWFHEKLLTALNQAGRRADALRAYQHTRRVLGEELGLGPSEELERIHQSVLTGKAS